MYLRYLNNKESEGIFVFAKDDCHYQDIKARLSML